MPRLCEAYPGICHTTEEKAQKSLSQTDFANREKGGNALAPTAVCRVDGPVIGWKGLLIVSAFVWHCNYKRSFSVHHLSLPVHHLSLPVPTQTDRNIRLASILNDLC